MRGEILSLAVVGVGAGVASWRAGVRLSRVDAALDSDAIESRAAWGSDVVAVASLVLTAALSLILRLSETHGMPAAAYVPAALLILAVLFLAKLLKGANKLMNGYPESLLRRFGGAGPLLPGLVTSVVGQLVLVLSAAL